MINIITGRYDNNKIGSIEIEVTLDESHNYINEVTDYPVEEGFNISDNVYQKPEEITLTGMYSDTPLTTNQDQFVESMKGAGENRMQSALESLLTIAGRSLPKQKGATGIVERQIEVLPLQYTVEPLIIDVVTTLRVYTNMICTSLTIPVSRQTGKSIRFTIKFKKIRTVESKIVSIDRTSDLNGKAPNVNNQAPKTKDTGKQTKKEVDQGTILYRWFF